MSASEGRRRLPDPLATTAYAEGGIFSGLKLRGFRWFNRSDLNHYPGRSPVDNDLKGAQPLPLTEEEERIQEEAFAYAKMHRAALARKIVDLTRHPPEEHPFTVFMAGSPGAGKTEVSKAIVFAVEDSADPDFSYVLRIDPDEYRSLLPGYEGNNSWLFQKAVIKILEKVLDRAFKQSVAFILDGTLSSYEVARSNTKRALDRGRVVQILYVYQCPIKAWSFVQDREVAEGRNIPLEAFVRQYFDARRNVMALKREFGDQIHVDLLIQSDDDDEPRMELNVTADTFDASLPESYDEKSLYQLLSTDPQGSAYEEHA